MKVRFRNKLESFVRCEEQLWPDCGGPSNTFLPRQQSTSKHLFSFMMFGVGSEIQRMVGGSGVPGTSTKGFGSSAGVGGG